MTTVVAVTDRPGWGSNTDNIVAVLPRVRTLLWLPRDLLSERYGCRINAVFARHGHAGLIRAVRDLRIPARNGVCVQRELVERMLADVSVEVPVPQRREYWYPLTPQAPIEEGRRVVRFDAPSERLEGMRVHEWLGARIGIGRMAGDLDRIRRQQVLVRALMRAGFDAQTHVAARPDLWWSTGPAAGRDLSEVGADWRTVVVTRIVPATYHAQKVALAVAFRGRAGVWHGRRVARRAGATLD